MPEKLEKTDAEWREQLTEEQYTVSRQAGTEAAFSGKYWDCKTDGIYRCVCCGSELFDSSAKFDSGTGWPSFSQALAEDRVQIIEDSSHGMVRTEVVCARCKAHLVDAFPDGPAATRQRYWMNSASLDLEERE